MRRIQKIALFNVIVITCTFLITAAAIAIAYVHVGFPKAWAGLGFLGIAGIGGLAPIFFKKDNEVVECDERDKEIQRKAALVGFAVAYLVVGLATMGPYTILGPHKEIKTCLLPLIFAAAGLSHYYSWSIVILSQYGWRKES